MSDSKILKIGITQGDINGIGTEVIIKTLTDSRICELFTPVIYGSSKVFAHYRKGIEGAENFSVNVITSPNDSRPKRVNLIEAAGNNDLRINEGESTQDAGRAAVEFLRAAVKDLCDGTIDALVTGPINKETVQADGFEFTGHTEYLASEFEGEPLMIMCSDVLRVGLATIHLPLAKVAENIGRELIVKRLGQLRDSLRKDFSVIEPRIAVLSLNPHAGDGGLLGSEEKDIIKPAILEASDKGVLAFGPFAADGFFAAGEYKKYDAVLAMYHDQGLTPFKTLCPYGVNFTAGLNVVRTSPDHGVAYDIAGQNKADEASMREAIYAAIDIWRNRKVYAEITANPLRSFERERGADISVRDLKLPEPTED